MQSTRLLSIIFILLCHDHWPAVEFARGEKSSFLLFVCQSQPCSFPVLQWWVCRVKSRARKCKQMGKEGERRGKARDSCIPHQAHITGAAVDLGSLATMKQPLHLGRRVDKLLLYISVETDGLKALYKYSFYQRTELKFSLHVGLARSLLTCLYLDQLAHITL